MLFEYTQLAQAIKAQVKSIIWIDIDKGQLVQPETYNSLIVPSVLIGLADITWRQLSGGFQQGEGSIIVKTVYRLPSQTHLTEPLLAESLAMLTLSNDVSDAVLSVAGVKSRMRTREYPSGSFYVNEQTFAALFTHGPTYTTQQVSLTINPQLINPHT